MTSQLPMNGRDQAPAGQTPGERLPAPWNTVFSVLTRTFVWGLFFATLTLLRAFFLLLFLTFVFSYILANGAGRLAPYVKSRSQRVLLFSGLFLTVLTAVIIYLTPRVIDQTENFVTQFGVYTQAIDHEIMATAARYPVADNFLKRLMDPEGSGTQLLSPTGLLLKQVVGMGGGPEGDTLQAVGRLFEGMRHIGSRIVSAVSAFFLALLFSFLIVLDLPTLEASVRGLSHTRLRFIYEEVAESVRSFGEVLGQAFEAQFLIAAANTALTAVGLYLLGLGHHAAFLCVIVFLFSFVPVAGVFISSVPICLIALQVAGVKVMFAAIGLITVIHLIEGYILNPQIYGTRMRINPVIVLIILTIGGTLFQFWGLILGVPVCTYIFGHAIRLERDKVGKANGGERGEGRGPVTTERA